MRTEEKRIFSMNFFLSLPSSLEIKEATQTNEISIESPGCSIICTSVLNRGAQISQKRYTKNNCPLQRTEMNRLALGRIYLYMYIYFHGYMINEYFLSSAAHLKGKHLPLATCPLTL